MNSDLLRVAIVEDPAVLLRADAPAGSVRYSPAVVDSGELERSVPRLVVEMPTPPLSARVGPYVLVAGMTASAALLIAFTPLGFLGFMALFCAAAVGLMTIPSTLMRGPEVLEVDSRYTSLRRGRSFVVWPTSDHENVRVRAARATLGTRLVGVTAGLASSAGRVAWGQATDGLSYGTAGLALDDSGAKAVCVAVQQFLAEHPADMTVRFTRGQTFLSQQESHVPNKRIDTDKPAV